MKYYEVAAKWWADNLRNIENYKSDNRYDSLIEQFEKSLAETIKDIVEKEEYLLISPDIKIRNILTKISRIIGVNVNCFPKLSMIVRANNITVYSDYQSDYKIIFLKNS